MNNIINYYFFFMNIFIIYFSLIDFNKILNLIINILEFLLIVNRNKLLIRCKFRVIFSYKNF
jgi:hypothetical protein